jgi:hypothetical protein
MNAAIVIVGVVWLWFLLQPVTTEGKKSERIEPTFGGDDE